MSREKNPNLEILSFAVEALGELVDKMVFVGGCATGLLITDNAAPPIRITKDVDAIVHVVSLVSYYQLSEKLRSKGFKEDTSENAPICRWLTDNVILDIMPTDPDILGFGNSWYSQAMKNASVIELPSNKKIHLISAPYFLITKLAAFDGRGKDDYLMSHDIEDIVAVLDGRHEILNEVKQAEPDLKVELSARFIKLQRDARFVEAISGHMPSDAISQLRVPAILKTIAELAHI